MLTSSALYKTAIHAPQQQGVFQVDLYDGPGGPVIARDVPVFGGSVSANLQHRVTRTGSFTLSQEWWPGSDPVASLTPYRTVAQIRAGIRYGDGSRELFPIITGRVGDVTRNADGSVSAAIDDLAADVIGVRFEQPRNSDRVPVLSEIRRLISEALPEATFGTDDVSDADTPALTWDEDRGQALDNLASALGGRWYALGSGDFVVRAFPYDVGAVVQTVADTPSGLLVSGAPTISRRDGAANSVTVIVERFDGGSPFAVTARDNSPSSPTRWGGPFGRVTKVIKVQTPLTLGQATTLARAELNASVALSSKWSIQMVPDYTLEPGDTIRAKSRGDNDVQLIDSITYPLGPATMGLSTRAYVRAQVTLD